MSEEVADIQLHCGCGAVYCTKRKVSERASVGLFVREREFSDHNTGNERGGWEEGRIDQEEEEERK